MSYSKLPRTQLSKIENLSSQLNRKRLGSHLVKAVTGTKNRRFYIPNSYSKRKQRELLKIIESIPLSESVYSKKGKSYVKLANLHKDAEYVVSLDIKDFFPSVNVAKIRHIYSLWGLGKESADRLTRLTSRNNYVPLGYCTSPMLANLAFHPIDRDLERLCRKKGLLYTRYVDDITISGDVLPEPLLLKIDSIIKSYGFKINKTKTHVYKPGEDREILGLLIRDGVVDVAPVFRQKLLEDIALLNHVLLSEDDISGYETELKGLQGRLQFMRQVNQDSYIWAVSLEYAEVLRRSLKI